MPFKPFVFLRTLFLFVLLMPLSGGACQCPVSSLSKDECGKYEVILKGKVIEVKPCADKPGEAWFEVQELYKGMAEKRFKLLYSCEDPCFYQFRPGEEWILYSRYRQVNTASMDYCSRSRRFFSNDKEDYYISTHGCTYEEELTFLRRELGLHRLTETKENVVYGRNQLPSNTQSLIIMLGSIVALVLFYQLFRRFAR